MITPARRTLTTHTPTVHHNSHQQQTNTSKHLNSSRPSFLQGFQHEQRQEHPKDHFKTMVQITTSSLVQAFTATTSILVSTLTMVPRASALPYPYGESFSGDGTYYGEIPLGDGNCAFDSPDPSIYDGMIPMAVSKWSMYENSAICGACIEGTASGSGSGHDPLPSSFKGFVSDSCGECAQGDLDFARSGDGRWDVSWKFVECPKGGEPSFIFEGSNEWYWKIQPRETGTPVTQLWVNGDEATMTQDNFFTISNGPYKGKQLVEFKKYDGNTESAYVSQ